VTINARRAHVGCDAQLNITSDGPLNVNMVGCNSIADLSIQKSDSADPVNNGSQFSYTLTAHNDGPDTASNVQITDPLPSGVSFDTASSGCSEGAGTVTCDVGDLAPGADAQVTISVTAREAGLLSNTASVSASANDDPDTTNDSDTETTDVQNVFYPRPKGATPIIASLVPAFTECTSPNSTHGAPLADGSCSPPSQASGFLTVGTPDANGKVARAAGTVRLDVAVGVSGPPDDSDVRLTVNMSDVRNKGDLSDYTGELQVDPTVRITDRRNGPNGIDPATVEDLAFPITVPCAETGGTTDVGSSCAVSTTANTVMPGAIIDAKREVWELSQLRVRDGGADGLASTAPNDVFAVQGIFVP
jgi:uncharacterized repeat protein (TIGR01451 family)